MIKNGGTMTHYAMETQGVGASARMAPAINGLPASIRRDIQIGGRCDPTELLWQLVEKEVGVDSAANQAILRAPAHDASLMPFVEIRVRDLGFEEFALLADVREEVTRRRLQLCSVEAAPLVCLHPDPQIKDGLLLVMTAPIYANGRPGLLAIENNGMYITFAPVFRNFGLSPEDRILVVNGHLH